MFDNVYHEYKNVQKIVWVQWFTSAILAIQEAEIGRIKVQGQPGQRVHSNDTCL
jgi:hypothetical protein